MNPRLFRTNLVSKLLGQYNASCLVLFPFNKDSSKFLSARTFSAFVVYPDGAKILATKYHEDQLEIENQEGYEIENIPEERINEVLPAGNVMIPSDTPYCLRKMIERKVVLSDELFRRVLRKPLKEDIEVIREGVKILDRSLEKAMNEISVGMKESEISDIIDSYLIGNGIEYFSYRTIVVSGKRTSCPLARTTDKRIEKGEVVILDSSPIYKGYQLGIARTILTEDNKEHLEYLRLLNSVVMRALEIIRPGEKANKLDLLCRELMSSRNLDYPHYTAFPLGGFYSPYSHPNSEDIFETNSVFFLTLGIYKRDFGMRIKHQILLERKPRILESFGTIK